MHMISYAALACLLAACSPETNAPDTAAPPSGAAEGSAPATTSPEAGSEDRGTLRIYSARHYDSDKLMYEAFEDASVLRVVTRLGWLKARSAWRCADEADKMILKALDPEREVSLCASV